MVTVNMRHKKQNVKKRTIGLNIPTYQKLEAYKARRIGETGKLNITFDDSVNELLDLATPALSKNSKRG